MARPTDSEEIKLQKYNEFIQKIKDNGIYNEIEILGNFVNFKTPLKCKCKNHPKYDWNPKPQNLIKGKKCRYCAREYTNKVNTKTNEEFDVELHKKFPYLKRIENYEKTTIPIKFYCEDCGNFFKKRPDKILSRIGCPYCKDNISFPNKLIYNILDELKIDFDAEWSPVWANKKRYDVHFYFNTKEYIIEMDGAFHYQPHKNNPLTLKEIQEIDNWKTAQAEQHDIIIIRIDCNKNTHNQIIEQVKQSKLKELFNLKNLNWEQILIKSESSIKKNIWEEYNKNPKISLNFLAKKFKINKVTLYNILREGSKLQKCNYIITKQSKPVVLFDKQGNFLKKYNCLMNFYKSEDNKNFLSRERLRQNLIGECDDIPDLIIRYNTDIDEFNKPCDINYLNNKYNTKFRIIKRR